MVKKTLLFSFLLSFFISTYSQSKAMNQVQNKEMPSLKGISIRTNVIPWVVLTPNLGLEYRPSNSFGLLVNGAYAAWSWDNKTQNHKLWQVAPQARLYLGRLKDSYIGLEGQVGQYNLKYSPEGLQGDFIGGGLSLGHQFYISRNLMLDLGFSVGYLHLKNTEEYQIINDRNIRTNKYNHGYWGPTALSMTFVWKIN